MAGKGDINKKSIQPSFHYNWLFVNFEQAIEKTNIITKLSSKEYSNEGVFPVVDQGANLISGYVDDEKVLYKGNLPIVIFGDHTRNIKFIDFPFAIGADGTKVLSPKKNINIRFFYYYLKSLNIPDFGYSRHFAVLKELDFPIPPLAEQERIVTKLDTLFAQHEAIKQALERIPQLLKDFRQQLLTQAVTGKLTKEWRNNSDFPLLKKIAETPHRSWKFNLPEDWSIISFDQAAIIKSNLVNPNLYSNHILIAPDNLEANTGKIINKPIVSEIKPISGKHLFQSGSIIYSKIRPYLNKLAIVDFSGLCSADMYPILNSELTIIEFVFYYMMSNEFLNYSTTAGERSVLPKINQKGLNEIPFPLPSLIEQREIINRVESLFSKADKIEEKYKALKAKVATLPQAILHKAFKGELVEQLLTDGDAKDLLEEIKKLKTLSKMK
ncbi:restriction endonuclease subunit S [Pedobacter sp.]|uniref:restriction endonuclease subunit S n=1 Tax=Pedobacter sp. TaxID=1411316 RepID=UPI0031D3A73D